MLLALLDPPRQTPALEALHELGVTYESVRAQVAKRYEDQTEGAGVTSAPSYHIISGWAKGLALGMGSSAVTDEHALIALLFRGQVDVLEVDPDEVLHGLRERGVSVPDLLPPAPDPAGPAGPVVYFPAGDRSSVTRSLVERYLPGTARWGGNVSAWKPGLLWVAGEEAIPMEELVRGAVADPSMVEVLSLGESVEREKEARRSGSKG